MNLPLHIAKRYLFAKKSHNAINIISLISVCGIIVATLALVCVLSVFNGFTDLVSKTFIAFDPDLQITPAKGKVFDPTTTEVEKIKTIEEIDFISESLEENALLRFGDRQEPVLMKGVTSNFSQLADIDKLIIDGNFILHEGDIEFGVIGAGLAMHLGVRAHFVDPLEIYVPKRNVKVNLSNPSTAFDKADVYTSGVFTLNQPKYDDQLIILSIDLVRELLRYDKEVSSLDIKLKDGTDVSKLKRKIKESLGDNYLVKDRFEQQEDLYQMVNIEKWIAFLILSIILLIAVFNVVGSLSMLIIEKNDDIKVLQNLGGNRDMITKIFLFEGWLITFVGSMLGLIIGIAICLIQEHFGLLKLGTSPGVFVIDAFPVSVEWSDILIIFIMVNLISFLAITYPVKNLRKILNQ